MRKIDVHLVGIERLDILVKECQSQDWLGGVKQVVDRYEPSFQQSLKFGEEHSDLVKSEQKLSCLTILYRAFEKITYLRRGIS